MFLKLLIYLVSNDRNTYFSGINLRRHKLPYLLARLEGILNIHPPRHRYGRKLNEVESVIFQVWKIWSHSFNTGKAMSETFETHLPVQQKIFLRFSREKLLLENFIFAKTRWLWDYLEITLDICFKVVKSHYMMMTNLMSKDFCGYETNLIFHRYFWVHCTELYIASNLLQFSFLFLVCIKCSMCTFLEVFIAFKKHNYMTS